jgi:CRISPR type III-B/RAMP module-associated protein Cmr5
MENKRTLDQIRVAVALRAKGKIASGADGGDKIKNFPTMIQNNGLLGALAYSVEYDEKNKKYKNKSEYDMSQYVVNYLNELKLNYYSVTGEQDIENPEALIAFLSNCSPEQFRRINAEVMAFLNYFRRFAS